MKSDTTNTILTFALGVLILLGVIFAIRTINRTRDLTSLQIEAINVNNNYMRLQSLLNDVSIYNQKNPSPEITKLLQMAR